MIVPYTMIVKYTFITCITCLLPILYDCQSIIHVFNSYLHVHCLYYMIVKYITHLSFILHN